METLLANLSVRARRVTENGREWLVAPMTLIREGVLSGSKGALFYSASEIRKALSAWDGVPITLGHPTDSTNNTHLSARSPGVLDATGLGIVRHPRMDGDRLRAEGWFDIARLKKVSPAVLAGIEASRAMHVSTGLYTTNQPKADSHNGRAYVAVAADHVPDHLAVLVDATGACSVRDGCGLMVNQYLEPGDECPECGNSLSEREVEEGFCENCGADLELVGNSKGKPSLFRRFMNWLTRNAAPGLTHADYLLRAALVQHMQRTDTAGALEDVRDGHAVFSHEGKTFRRKYTSDGDTFAWDGDPEEVRKVGGHYRRPKGAGAEVGAPEESPAEVATTANREDTDMDRNATIGWLVANCDCWKTKGPVLANKDAFTDAELALLKTSAEKAGQDALLANAARAGLGDRLVANASADDTEAMMKKCKELMDAEKKEPAVNVAPAPVASRLTPEEQEDLAFARQEKNRQKAVLVERLTANVADPARKAELAKKYMAKELEDLQERLEIMPPADSQDGMTANGPPLPIFYGAAGAPPQAPAKDDSDNLLPMPTVNYGEMASPALRKKA